jgi:ubiquinone/menaquinone biosynthesis C-methylase UbiE
MDRIGKFGTKFIVKLLRLFFSLLYHQFAWTYDWVASIVSIGRWNQWIMTVIPYLTGSNILEIGHGPGHLLVELHKTGKTVIGLDRSSQMSQIAHRRMIRRKISPGLVRGEAQTLPFREVSLDHIVATFPSEYTFDIKTLSETYRVLKPGGTLVIVPYAWITGTNFADKIATWLFKVTGETPIIEDLAVNPLVNIGYSVNKEIVELTSSNVLIVRAQKPPE